MGGMVMLTLLGVGMFLANVALLGWMLRVGQLVVLLRSIDRSLLALPGVRERRIEQARRP